MADTLRERKAALRAASLASRTMLSAEAQTAAGDAIARIAVATWASATTVAAYFSIADEPPTRALIDGLIERGVGILLPVIDGDALDWAAYAGTHDLAAGPFGITEPTGARLGPNAVDTADVILVPALAVDRRGNRLGRGRGYYDRGLATVAAPLVAVGYDAELVDDVPVEPHDRPVNGLLRPSGLTWVG